MSIDLHALRERAMPMRDGFYHAVGYYRALRREDFDALIAEVERLRDEANEMRRWAEEAAHAENLNALDAQKERAAVVAWLREYEGHSSLASLFALMADTIERGEHRRKEETP